MITRKFGTNFEVADYTGEILMIPNQWGILNQSGLFMEEGVETYSVQFEQTTKDGALLVDKVRGERASANKEQGSKVFSWAIPHYNLDDYISPSDIKGKRAYGSADQEETLAAVRARRLARIAQNHAWTLEYARFKVLTTGDIYAPNGTVSLNYWSELSVTRKEIDFDLDTSTVDPIAKVEEVIAHIQDNANGESVQGIVGYCSSGFFSKLISHANVKAAYAYYASSQEPLRNRLGGNSTMYRQFDYAGIRFIEVRGNYAGNVFIPANDAVFVPVGTEAFRTYLAPANKFDLLGTVGERMYAFEYPSERGDRIVIESEANFLNSMVKPAMVVRGFTG